MAGQQEDEDERFVPEEAARVQYIQGLLKVDELVADGGPWDLLIERALEDAHAAITKLVHGKFETIDEVRQAQWEATRFEQLAGYVNSIVLEAREEIDQLAADQRREATFMIQGEQEGLDD